MQRIEDYCAKCTRSYPPPIKNYSLEEWERFRQELTALVTDIKKSEH